MTLETYFEKLMELFSRQGIPVISLEQTQRIGHGDITFSVSGERGSVVRYRIWGPGVVNVWMGKADSDSGGMATQGQIPNHMEHVLKLHKRFAASGRRKVLRRAQRS